MELLSVISKMNQTIFRFFSKIKTLLYRILVNDIKLTLNMKTNRNTFLNEQKFFIIKDSILPTIVIDDIDC